MTVSCCNSREEGFLDMKPEVFDDAELGTILAQLSGFYHVNRWSMWMPVPSTSVSSSTGTRRRLWSRTEILNAFDRIQIEYIDGTLLVK